MSRPSAFPNWATTASGVFDMSYPGPIAWNTIFSGPNGIQAWLEYIDSKSSGGGTWGSITGTLSDQTDLQAALDGKLGTSGVAVSATKLATARNINGVAFDGTASITIADPTKVVANGAITGATYTKITFDSKGLVTAGSAATTADIADSTDKRYCTDAQKTIIGNTSGTNTGDQTSVTGNAGTATKLATARNINGVPFDGTADILIGNLYNSNGGTYTDICTKIGTNRAVVAGANLMSVRSSIGGSESEFLSVIAGSSVAASQVNVYGQISVAHGATFGADLYASGNLSCGGTVSGGNISGSGTVSGSNLSGTNTGDLSILAPGISPNDNGCSLASGQQFYLQPADGTHPGILTSGVQTIGGTKTFTSAPIMPAPTWISVTWNTGWTNLSSGFQAAQYCIDTQGFVRIRGHGHRTSGSNTTAFTLPAGCRPPKDQFFATDGGGAHAEIYVYSTGNVTFTQYGSGALESGVSFNLPSFSINT